jgi:hypothetical protein
MDRMPVQGDLTAIELATLREIARGFRSRALGKTQLPRLVQLGLVQAVMGGVVITPAGRIVAR